VSIYRLVLPAFILSFVVTGMTFLFNEQVVPAATTRLAHLNRALKKEKVVFGAKHFLSRIPEVKQRMVQSKDPHAYFTPTSLMVSVKGLTIVDRSQSGLNQIVSESAMWNTAQNIWDFQRHYLFGGLIVPTAIFCGLITNSCNCPAQR